MRVYALTRLGRKMAEGGHNADEDEMAVLRFIRNNHTATDEDVEGLGLGRWITKKLKNARLIVELTGAEEKGVMVR